MPKIKINEIKSIYTNIDENDSSLDLVRTSINLRHRKGFAEFEPRYLSTYDIPNLQNWFGQSGWTWETGIYCTLTNDPFAEDPIAAKYDSLVLIAKRTSGGTYYRSIFWKNLSSDTWYETTKEGSLEKCISRTFLNTTKDGKTFFQVENGRLKIYMPHDCFWLGYINRDSNFNYIDYNNIYCDRLVEPYDHNKQFVKFNGIFDITFVPPNTPPDWITCGTGRRLGFKFQLEYKDDPTQNIGAVPITWDWATPPSNLWRRVQGHWNKYYLAENFARDSESSESLYPPIETVQWFDEDDDPMPIDTWPFFISPEVGYWVIPKAITDVIQPVGTDWPAISVAPGLSTWPVTRGPGLDNGEVANSYKIGGLAMQGYDWEYWPSNQNIESQGYSTTSEKEFSILVTALLDDREEIVVELRNEVANVTNLEEHYVIKVTNIYIPTDINKRVTRFRIYHKLKDSSLDFTLHKEIDLLDLDEVYNKTFYISKLSDTGTTLASNIAFLMDEEKPQEYIIKQGFRSFVTESGISIALTNDDYTRSYYSVLGGGQLQPDLIYSQNLLPISGVSKMNAVVSINDRFGVFTDTTLYIISEEEVEGALIFRTDEATSLGVKNPDDVANIQGGAIVHTRNGIFITSTTDQVLISEPINDLVKTYFTTGSIKYNKHFNELYYRPLLTSEDLYRFRFEDKTWERINATIDAGDMTSGLANFPPVKT